MVKNKEAQKPEEDFSTSEIEKRINQLTLTHKESKPVKGLIMWDASEKVVFKPIA